MPCIRRDFANPSTTSSERVAQTRAPAFRLIMNKAALRTTAASVPLLILSFWVALYLAWNTLSTVNFLYPWLHDQMGLGATIEKFGALNRYKDNFEATDRTEHIRLFKQIVHAINHNGEGLAEIRYHDPQGQPIDTLLRPPEVVHLQDVANLLAALRLASYAAIATLAVLIALIIGYRIPVPGLLRLFLITAIICATTAGAIITIGATDVFYAVHTWVFPPDHQWFFYYQESLMTTLMKAPDIFGYIAILLLLTAMTYFTLMLWITRRMASMSTKN